MKQGGGDEQPENGAPDGMPENRSDPEVEWLPNPRCGQSNAEGNEDQAWEAHDQHRTWSQCHHSVGEAEKHQGHPIAGEHAQKQAPGSQAATLSLITSVMSAITEIS
jgi:hypothetical protein